MAEIGEVAELYSNTIQEWDWRRDDCQFVPGALVHRLSERMWPWYEVYSITEARLCGNEQSPFYRYFGAFVEYVPELPVEKEVRS